MKLYCAFEDLQLHDDMLNDTHDILEKAMKVYSKMKQTSKTHRSVADKNFSDVCETKASIFLDSVQIEIGKSNGTMNERIDKINFGVDQKANVKKEIVTFLIRKMEQM